MAEPTGPKKRQYVAHVELYGTLETPEADDPHARPALAFWNRRVRLYPSEQARAFLSDYDGDDPLRFLIYPRTLKGSYLAEESALARASESKEGVKEGTFLIAGKLAHINRDDALLIMYVHANPGSAFVGTMVLDVQVSLEQLESLPKVGEGVQITGAVKPRTGRLVATKIKQVEMKESSLEQYLRKKDEAKQAKEAKAA